MMMPYWHLPHFLSEARHKPRGLVNMLHGGGRPGPVCLDLHKYPKNNTHGHSEIL